MAFMHSRVMLSAFELGIFSYLGKQEAGSSQVAEALGLDPRATDRLMNACVSLGIMSKKGGVFSNTEVAAKHLDENSPDYMGGLGHAVRLWNAWHTLSGAVKAGTSVKERDNSSESTEAFIASMHNRGSKVADKTVQLVDLNGVERALDLGGGSGVFAMALCRARKGLKATVLDTPKVIPLTRKYVSEAGLSASVDFIEGDFTKDEYGQGYDLIMLSAIMHIYSPEENLAVIKRCAKALNPGGRAVIREFVVDQDRTSPAWPVMFALNMLVNTKGGDTYTQADMFSWMEQAGLVSLQRKDLDETSALIIGTKPKA